jgi:hypothetical protein
LETSQKRIHLTAEEEADSAWAAFKQAQADDGMTPDQRAFNRA